MSRLDELLSNQDRHWDELCRLAEVVAKNAGWKRRGVFYSHPQHGNIAGRDIDGWFDLCGIAGLELDDHEDEIKHLLPPTHPTDNAGAAPSEEVAV